MNGYQLKGILISLLFIAVGFALGADLGRLFFVAVALACAVATISFALWVAKKALWRR